MHIPRRFLPPLSLLTAFEAAARTGSVTAAAKEINLTQSAVSRQIKALEEQLGVQLFIRDRQTIRLTLSGESYAREIREAVRHIGKASLNLRANPYGGTLNLAVPPTFGERWLAPRLDRFVAQCPHVMLNVSTRIVVPDFHVDPQDAAIQLGPATSADLGVTPLRGEIALPVCSPRLLNKAEYLQVSDLKAAPLLHLTTRPDAWEQWFLHHGQDPGELHGMLFEHYSMLTAVAAAGLGVALIPTFLCDAELQAGTLVPALQSPVPSPERYLLTWPRDRSTYGPLIAFRQWLLAELPPDRDTF